MNAPLSFRPKLELPSEIPETNPYLEHIKACFQGGILGSEYLTNWHVLLKTWYLHLWTIGQILRLIIMEPPQYGKTEPGGVHLPGYVFKYDPTAPFGYMTYGQDRANTISERAKNVMRSPQYIEEMGGPEERDVLTVPLSQTGVKKWQNSLGGTYWAWGREAGADGESLKYMVFDDLYKNQKEGLSPQIQQTTWETYQAIGNTRIPPDGRILLYFKRWHTLDVIGRCLSDMEKSPYADQYEVLFFPAVLTPENYHLKHPLDPREIGEPLWPHKHTANELKAREIGMGKALFEASFQQVPLNAKGLSINIDWFAKKITRSDIPKGLTWFRYYRIAATEKGSIDQQNATCLMAKSSRNEFFVKELKIIDGGWSDVSKLITHTANLEPGVKIGILNATGKKQTLVDNILESKPKRRKIKTYDAVDPLSWAADAQAGKILLMDDSDTEKFIDACQVYTGSGKDINEATIQALAGAWNMIKSKRSVTQAMAAKNKNNPKSKHKHRRSKRWLPR